MPPQPFVNAGDPTDLKFVCSLIQAHGLETILCTSDDLAAQLLQSLTRSCGPYDHAGVFGGFPRINPGQLEQGEYTATRPKADLNFAKCITAKGL